MRKFRPAKSLYSLLLLFLTPLNPLTPNGRVERARHPHGPCRPQHFYLLALVDEHLVEGGQGVAHLRHDDAGHVDERPLLTQRHAAAYGGGDAQPFRYQDFVRQEFLHEHAPQAGLYLGYAGTCIKCFYLINKLTSSYNCYVCNVRGLITLLHS